MKTKHHVPSHLARYVVEQDYTQYTPEEQAVWRFILRQLKRLLSSRGHECYLEGLEKTGLHEDRIPRLSEMNKKLAPLGWATLAVSGFIPPAAFMELQSLGFLPIAVEIRRRENILYTPAPDIVHEAAGHAPILVNPDFSNYLKQYASTARCAIVSDKDLALYDAIRELSDVKEDPASTAQKIQHYEDQLQQAQKAVTQLSEAQQLGRMNWWTVEYGLIGTVDRPRIFGAGLLSSILEAQTCLDPKVTKILLSLDCIEYDYNITEPQPQLFVASSFKHLEQVLNQMADTMAFRKGGVWGVEQAMQAGTVNTVVLDSGVQISGQWERCIIASNSPEEKHAQACFLKTKSPTQLAFQDVQLPGHGTEAHAEGYSLPLGQFELMYTPKDGGPAVCIKPDKITKNESAPQPTSTQSRQPYADEAQQTLSRLEVGTQVQLNYLYPSGPSRQLEPSGVVVKGRIHKQMLEPVHLCTLSDCHIQYEDQVLFEPSWGLFDLLFGTQIVSVFGGAADRSAFEGTSFEAHRVPPKKSRPQPVYDLYNEIYKCRCKIEGVGEAVNSIAQNNNASASPGRASLQQIDEVKGLSQQWLKHFSQHWLAGLELKELLDGQSVLKSVSGDVNAQLQSLLQSDVLSKDEKLCLKMGL